MNEKLSKTIIACVCGTAGYIAYVCVTKGDGAVFGVFCTFIGAVLGVSVGKLLSKAT